MTVREARALTKTYIGGDGGTIKVLDAIDLKVSRGEMVAIIGSSGAGKSTLLHLLGALDRPTAGQVLFDGKSIGDLTDDAISALRNTITALDPCCAERRGHLFQQLGARPLARFGVFVRLHDHHEPHSGLLSVGLAHASNGPAPLST